MSERDQLRSYYHKLPHGTKGTFASTLGVPLSSLSQMVQERKPIPIPHRVIEKLRRTRILTSEDAPAPGNVTSVSPIDIEAVIQRTVAQTMASLDGKTAPKFDVYRTSLDDLPSVTNAVVLSDLHIPYDDRSVIALVEDFIKVQKFEHIILDGDLLDFDVISDFSPSPFSVTTFSEQIVMAKAFLARLRKDNPTARIIFIPGNHEYRLVRYLMRHARELAGLGELKLGSLLGLDTLKIELKDSGLKETYIQFGDLYIGHWNMIRMHSGWTAKALIEKKGVSVVQAHTHRLGLFRKACLGRTLVGIESGCLCQLDPIWDKDLNWHHGFVVVKKIGDKCYPEAISITDGQFFYHGQLWSSSPR